MGCNCKKTKIVAEPQPTPAPIPLTQEEIDWFTNIDVIEPIKDKKE